MVRFFALLTFAGAACSGELLPSQYTVNYWGPDTGLPEERIHAITQTKDGFLWLGTSNGLVRYDGTVFQLFQSPLSMVRNSRSIRSILALEDGSLLAWSRSGNIYRFAAGVFHHLATKKFWSSYSTGGFVRRSDGQVVLLSPEGVFAMRGGKLEPVRLAGDIRDVTASADDSRGAVWWGTAEGRVFRTSRSGDIEASYSVSGPVHGITVDTNRRVWIASEGGFYRIRDNAVLAAPVPGTSPGVTGYSVLSSSDGSLYFASAKGFHRCLNGKGESLAADAGLPGDELHVIFEDREGNVWMAYRSTGLYRLRRPKFANWGKREGLDEPVRTVFRAGQGVVWIGTDGGLFRYQDGRVVKVALPEEHAAVLDVAQDGAGRLWVVGRKALHVVSPETLQVRLIAITRRGEGYFSAHRTSSGRLILTGRKGLFQVHGEQIRPLIAKPFEMDRGVAGIYETSRGNLLAAIHGEGLFELVAGRLIAYLPGELRGKALHTTHEDAAGDLWLGLDGGGLVRVRGSRVAIFGKSKADAAHFIYQIAEDADGNLWLGLRDRLLRVNKAELNRFLDGGSPPKRVVFGLGAGLRSANFGIGKIDGPPSREIWMATLRGAIQFDSRQVDQSFPPVPVSLQVARDDILESVTEDQLIVVEPGGRLRIRIVAPVLADPSRVTYRFRLDGYDSGWNGPQKAPFGVYTHLPPGDYRFRGIATNSAGEWTTNAATVRVRQEPFFYQSWWFQAVGWLLGFSVLAGAVRVRTKLLREHNRELERRVEERTAELEASKLEAEAAANAKSDFLATMSHEIRTPMHGVLGTLELLSHTPLQSEQREYVETIRSSSNALLVILNDVLDISKLEAGRMELHAVPIHFRRTVDEIARTLEPAALKKKVSLTAEVEDSVPQWVLADEARVRQVLFNIVGNAIKFTDRGAVRIQVRAPLAGWIEIEVSDTGIGIPEDRIPQLFQKFYQVDATSSRRHGGSGLGLAISQRLCEAMKGAIAVRSEAGKGSTFRVLLPLPATAGPVATPGVGRRGDLRFRGTVLLAEDNAINRKVGTRLLSKLGLEVWSAEDGRQAVEMSAKTEFDLIFMDCQMPEMDGFDATRAIRAREGQQPVIVALTANAMASTRDHCMSSGMNDYLSKPYSLDDLAGVVARYLPSLPAGADLVAGTQERMS